MAGRKLTIVLFMILILVVSILSGCTNVINVGSTDPTLQRAEPYISKVVVSNLTLRSYANEVLRQCKATSPEQKVNALYRNVVESYNYVSDPVNTEFIQTPFETMQIKGGDCEDLAILLVSLLENVGVKAYIVLTDTHAYALADDVNTTALWPYVEQSLIAQVEKDSGNNIRQYYNQTFVLGGNRNWYYGGNGTNLSEGFDYINITYRVQSNQQLDFYVVPTRNDFNLLCNGQTFYHYPDYAQKNVLSFQSTCPYIRKPGGIILCNKNWNDATVTVNLLFYYHPSFYSFFKNDTITYYTLNSHQCVVLDPTAGVYGFPGYDAGLVGKKIAVDPVSKQYYTLS